MGALEILRSAIKAVPALKYALGVAGIAAVVAIVLGFKLKPEVAVFGTLIVLGLMFVLVVFVRYANANNRAFATPAIVLVWFYTLAVVGGTSLFLTHYFLNWPSLGTDPLPSGNVTLYDGFHFPDQSVFTFSSGTIGQWNAQDADIGVANPNAPNAEFFLMNDSGVYTDQNATSHKVENAGIIRMRAVSLDDVKAAPADGYRVHYFVPEADSVYCVRTRDGHHFAKVKISYVAKDRISFDYVYQPSGSRNFSR